MVSSVDALIGRAANKHSGRKVLIVDGDLTRHDHFRKIFKQSETISEGYFDLICVSTAAKAVTLIQPDQREPFIVAFITEAICSGAAGEQLLEVVRDCATGVHCVFVAERERHAQPLIQLQKGELLLGAPFLDQEVLQLTHYFDQQLCGQLKEQEMRQRLEGTLESVLETVDESILVSDHEGQLLYVNGAATQLFGMDAERIIKSPLPTIQRLLKYEPNPARGEITIEKADGSHLLLHYAFRYWGSKHHKQQRHVLILSDLSSRVRIEAREQFAAFQAGVAEMSSSILHHVGNTIQSTQSSFAEMMQGIDEMHKLKEVFVRIQQQMSLAMVEGDLEKVKTSVNMLSLRLPDALEDLFQQFERNKESVWRGMEQIATAVRPQYLGPKLKGSLVRFSIVQLLDDLFILLETDMRRRAIDLQRQVDEVVPEVRLPRNQLLQVLMILITNSMEAIGEAIYQKQLQKGGGVIIIRAVQEDGGVKLVIEDNGDGIDPDIQHKLMRYGFTTKFNNQGFGLHVAGNFVASVGGKLTLDSQGKGEGAAAQLWLPYQMD